MTLYDHNSDWNIQEGKIHNLTEGQPVAMKSGTYYMTAFAPISDTSICVELVNNECTRHWYDVLRGVWVDEPTDCSSVEYNTKMLEHAQWIRLVRSLLEEKLSPEEIIKAEKLSFTSHKLTHRYTGGWKFEFDFGKLPDISKPMDVNAD